MKKYGDIVAVNGVSFRVKYGEILGSSAPMELARPPLFIFSLRCLSQPLAEPLLPAMMWLERLQVLGVLSA